MKLICYIYYADAISHVLRLSVKLQRQFRIREVVVIYNRKNISLLTPPPGGEAWGLLPYDGADWEFGAYQLGLDQLSRDKVEGVLVLNDTAGRNYPLFASNLRELARVCEEFATVAHPVIAGKLESQGHVYAIRGLTFTSWIRSNIFFVNRAGLDALSWRFFDAAVFAAPNCSEGVVTTGGFTSTALESYIANWLHAGSGKQGWLEHAGKAAARDSLLAHKAGSILLEKFLSARITAAGGRLLSYDAPGESWLARLRIKSFYIMRRISRMFK